MYEEKKVTTLEHDREPKSDKISNGPHGSVHGCSHERSEISNSLHEAACRLKNEIEHGTCQLSPENYDPECLKQCIIVRFPKVRYQNKLKMGLATGGYNGLLHSLRSFCQGQSAFVTFSLIDLGAYLRKVFTLKELGKPKRNNSLATQTTTIPTTRPTMKTEIEINSLNSVSQVVTPTTEQTVTQAQIIAENALRQQFIIKSIVAYFLRAVEQRLNCNVTFG